VACPTTIAELLSCAAEGRRPYAGGTDLLIQATNAGGELPPLAWTPAVAELTHIEVGEDRARIGAAATCTALLREARLAAGAACLLDASRVLGSVQIRNRATLAGNVCNASPAADTIPALAVHGATIEVRSRQGSRTVPVEAFASGPGQTMLQPGEVVASIQVLLDAPGWGGCYRRFTVRNSMDLAFAGVGVRLRLEPDGERIGAARLALGAVGPTVVMAGAAAELLVGGRPDPRALATAAEAAAQGCSPITDLRASAGFRRQAIRALVHDTVSEAYRRAQESVR
jgi:carbon-monoxide dehydrogenase medium subunit